MPSHLGWIIFNLFVEIRVPKKLVFCGKRPTSHLKQPPGPIIPLNLNIKKV